METTVAGVIGQQLPSHDDWELADSDDESCRWTFTRSSERDASLVLLYRDGDWSTSARTAVTAVERGEEVRSHKLTIVEADSLFEALDTIRDWMESPPDPS